MIDFGTFFIISVIVIIAVYMICKLRRYKEIRRRNPRMSGGQAFSQLVDEMSDDLERERAKKRAEREAENQRIAGEIHSRLIDEGCMEVGQVDGKTLYVNEFNQMGSYDPKTRCLIRF